MNNEERCTMWYSQFYQCHYISNKCLCCFCTMYHHHILSIQILPSELAYNNQLHRYEEACDCDVRFTLKLWMKSIHWVIIALLKSSTANSKIRHKHPYTYEYYMSFIVLRKNHFTVWLVFGGCSVRLLFVFGCWLHLNIVCNRNGILW